MSVKMLKRFFSVILIIVMTSSLTGCIKNPFAIEESFDDYYKKKEANTAQIAGMAEHLAVTTKEDSEIGEFDGKEKAALLINDTTKEIVVSRNCFKKIYPASTTKIMTALLVLENADFDEVITIPTLDTLESGAVISTLTPGSKATVEQVFQTMLIMSANDCAAILARHVAGTEEAFAEMMNRKAKELGATHTHFVNPHGLHNKDHYTTAYDLYLIFKEVLKYDRFVDVVCKKDNTMLYENAGGMKMSEFMQSTNYYLKGEYPIPDGVVMYGGKSGTTEKAGSCLILMTENESGERFFSLVFGAKDKEELYKNMTSLLEKTTK